MQRAINEFERLSKKAFSKNESTGIPIFRNLAQLVYSHRYKGEALNNALQEAFGQELLFGSNQSFNSDKVKVGVLAAVPGGRRPCLFTNYSRTTTGRDSDYLVREDNLEHELKCWEAARSTSAAPTYFPPYYHKPKRQLYIDGALHRNNPIQILEEERRAIWKDKAPPDILLSIGTGMHVDNKGCAIATGKTTLVLTKLLPKGIKGRIAVGIDVIQSTLDCNRQWDEFVSSMKYDKDTHRVCHRLNVGLSSRPPNLDDIDAFERLKTRAEYYLREESFSYHTKGYPSPRRHVQAVARRLIAALFYFEPTDISDGGERCLGTIHCRLGSGMRNNFRHLLSEGPMFRVRQRVRRNNWCSSELRPRFDILTFSAQVEFLNRSERRVIEMTLPKWGGSWERISGFSGLR